MSQQDKKFLDIMRNNTAQPEDGHYLMPLPFKEDDIKLPNNHSVAMSRLLQLKRRFLGDHAFYGQYQKVFDGMVSEGYAEPVPPDILPEVGSMWYLPHHGVYHPHKPDKPRVVFDGSSTFQGHFLNASLLTGPDLTNSLLGVLCRFRKEIIALMCEIEAMFHQFRVSPPNRDFLRFLWWPDDLNKDPVEYRMTVHLFGATYSPACTNFALKEIAKDFQHEHGQEAANFIRNNFYVDDGLTSMPTAEDCIALAQDTRELCKTGALWLHKFTSNSRKVLESIPASDRAANIRDMELSSDRLPMERALCIEWCAESDTLRFQISADSKPVTRGGILSTVCSIFDPLV